MEKPIRIRYCQMHVHPGMSDEDNAIIRAIDIDEDGAFNYQYNCIGGPKFIDGVTSASVLQRLQDNIPEGIFDPALAPICKAKFILPTTKFEEEMHLSVSYSNPESGGTFSKDTVLVWDAQKTFLDFPLPILRMKLAFHKIFDEIRDEAEQQVLDPCPPSMIDKLA